MNSIGWEAERSLYAEMRGTCSAIMHALFYLLPETYSESPLDGQIHLNWDDPHRLY